MSSAGFDNRFDIITISNAACLESGVSLERGCLQKGVPLSLKQLSTRRAPYADDEI